MKLGLLVALAMSSALSIACAPPPTITIPLPPRLVDALFPREGFQSLVHEILFADVPDDALFIVIAEDDEGFELRELDSAEQLRRHALEDEDLGTVTRHADTGAVIEHVRQTAAAGRPLVVWHSGNDELRAALLRLARAENLQIDIRPRSGRTSARATVHLNDGEVVVHEVQWQPGVDAEAIELLERTSNFYRGLPRVRAAAGVAVAGIAHRPRFTLAFERPNRIAILALPHPQQTGYAYISDGEQVFHFVGAPLNAYTLERIAPPGRLPLHDPADWGTASELVPGSGAAVTFEALIQGRLAMYGWPAAVRRLEPARLHGQLHERIRIDFFEQLMLDLWIAPGNEPWVNRAVTYIMPLEAFGRAANREPHPHEILQIVTFRWSSPQRMADASFTIRPPADAVQVDSLAEAMDELRARLPR
jgi:hypothetical protein